MAQLSDDCFAFGGPMMSVDEAVGLITTRVNAIADLETVSLVDADGRVLARDIAAPLPLPPFTNSAVDGYAVRNADLPQAAEQALPLDGRIQAGGLAQAPIKPGHTARIFTGKRNDIEDRIRVILSRNHITHYCTTIITQLLSFLAMPGKYSDHRFPGKLLHRILRRGVIDLEHAQNTITALHITT